MAPAAAPRKRVRKRKRRQVSSSESDSSSSSAGSDSETRTTTTASKKTAPAKAPSPEPSSSSSSSSSDESDAAPDAPKAHEPAAAKKAPSRSPSPVSGALPPFLAPEREQALKDKFRSFWMGAVADAFKDDLEQIRKVRTPARRSAAADWPGRAGAELDDLAAHDAHRLARRGRGRLCAAAGRGRERDGDRPRQRRVMSAVTFASQSFHRRPRPMLYTRTTRARQMAIYAQ